MLNIIARKPRPAFDAEFVLVDRGENKHTRYVVGTANEQSLKYGEWFWGHYFDDYDQAIDYFNAAN